MENPCCGDAQVSVTASGSGGGAHGSFWFLEHLEVFEEVLNHNSSKF